MSEPKSHQAYLVRIAGPAMAQLVLDSQRSPMTLGRHEDCELATEAAEERVSRRHAKFIFGGGRWLVADLKSTWGTYLNGYRLPPEQPYVLSEGDLVRITPWTFSFRASPVAPQALLSKDDLVHGAMTMVKSVSGTQSLAGDPIAMLVEAAAAIHQAADETTLAQLVTDMARRGTGYTNAAWLRPADAEGGIEVVAATMPHDGGIYSRALLTAASGGELAVLDSGGGPTSSTIVLLNIQRGLCVPLMLGQTVAAYLYLDSRDHLAASRIHARAQDFSLALARIASLSLANMKRIEIERRQATLNAQLQQAAAIQQYLLPKRAHTFGPLSITSESRAGQFVGGDFFDVIPLDDHRIALTLGDVSGKGVAASVLMTTIHGFLHAVLESGVALGDAVARLNAFLEPRRTDDRFATMFAAIVDIRANTLTYLDAAHGYGALWDGKVLTRLQEGGGPPLGIFTSEAYTCGSVPFGRGQMLIVVSDGIVEQPAIDVERQQFEVEGIERVLRAAAPGSDEVAALFAAVEKHAQTTHLADDATVLVAKWRG